MRPEPLSGWGRFPVVSGRLRRARDLDDLCRLAADDAFRGIPRGSGRSYGDACLAAQAVSMLPLRHLLSFDPEKGVLRAQAGVTLGEIIRFCLPRGWFLPVTPGTKHPTLGGCVAADVHGKNHHAVGAFSAFVDALEMVLPGGQVVRCSRTEEADLFWATLGGMGLTGWIHAASLRLQAVRSAWIDTLSWRTANLAETCQVLVETQRDHLYSVAWIDVLPRRAHRGRGQVLLGTHAEEGGLAPLHRRARAAVPRLPLNLVVGPGLRLGNWLKSHGQWRRRVTRRVHYDPYFYPLDGLEHWNRLYGPRGFLQFQFVVPFADGVEAMTAVLERTAQAAPCALAVLKTFGDHPGGPLAFPLPGYTLALDFPRTRRIEAAARAAADDVIAAGGRVYLAKDAVISPEQLTAMYPRLDEFRRLRRHFDPEGRLRSLQSDRLGLT